jgi:predicted  nucleic acid-binding Zn-ribbon protein
MSFLMSRHPRPWQISRPLPDRNMYFCCRRNSPCRIYINAPFHKRALSFRKKITSKSPFSQTKQLGGASSMRAAQPMRRGGHRTVPELSVTALMPSLEVGTGVSFFPPITPSPALNKPREVQQRQPSQGPSRTAHELQQSQRAVSRLERENETLKSENESLQAQNKRLTKQAEGLKRDLAELQRSSSDARLRSFELLNESDRQLEIARTQAAKAENRAAALQHELNEATKQAELTQQQLNQAQQRSHDMQSAVSQLESELESARATMSAVCEDRQKQFSKSMSDAIKLARHAQLPTTPPAASAPPEPPAPTAAAVSRASTTTSGHRPEAYLERGGPKSRRPSIDSSGGGYLVRGGQRLSQDLVGFPVQDSSDGGEFGPSHDSSRDDSGLSSVLSTPRLPSPLPGPRFGRRATASADAS